MPIPSHEFIGLGESRGHTDCFGVYITDQRGVDYFWSHEDLKKAADGGRFRQQMYCVRLACSILMCYYDLERNIIFLIPPKESKGRSQ